MLTPKTKELLCFIDDFQRERGGVSPSFREMASHLGLASVSGVHRLVCSLEERGFIRRLRDRARAIEVLKAPQVSGREASHG